MLRQRSGIIINILSIAAIGYTGYDYISYYAAKAAVNQFTVGLALQYAGDRIRVNAIMPGLMDTPHIYKEVLSQYSSREEMQKARNALCPMGRMGTAWDVADAAVFLASDESSYITGVCIPLTEVLHAERVDLLTQGYLNRHRYNIFLIVTALILCNSHDERRATSGSHLVSGRFA